MVKNVLADGTPHRSLMGSLQRSGPRGKEKRGKEEIGGERKSGKEEEMVTEGRGGERRGIWPPTSAPRSASVYYYYRCTYDQKSTRYSANIHQGS